jgi:glutamate synthase (NADPH/NADH) small chain
MTSKLTGFMEIDRKNYDHRDIEERKKDFDSVDIPLSKDEMVSQANRCLDCGTSFCNWGCPLGNLIPDWNDLVYNGEWEKAYQKLSLTANFPEFTGRVCPALCEAACVLGVNREAVSVREIEQSIAEMAFENGWVKPRTPRVRTGMKIAVIGSGPSGLAASDDLNALGHMVTIFEREENAGGLMRYGIPNYKLGKDIIERRIDLMKESGIEFVNGIEIGKDQPLKELTVKYDAVVMACGTWVPRDISIPGRNLEGIHFAVDYLSQQTKRLFDEKIKGKEIIAKGKNVLVIGGGDTGADCVGTANRQGAKKVFQYEILPKPPEKRDDTMPWPLFPKLLKNTTAHEEGCEREWEISTKEFVGSNGKIESIKGVRVKWTKDADGRFVLNELKKTEFEEKIDLVLIAAGFLHTEHDTFVKEMNIELGKRGDILTDEDNKTNVDKVFAAGDMRTGQSLVVNAILEGKNTAKKVDKYLNKKMMKKSG